MTARARAEAIVEAEGLIAAVQAALALDSDLLSATELQSIQSIIQTLTDFMQTGTADTLRQTIAQLSQATDDFAAKRMNRNIQRALMGQKVEAIS